MLTARQENLLEIIIEEYRQTGAPVGSKQLTDKLDCSSATIRNEMGKLEELGLIVKTHTSSGRVPSKEGYEYLISELKSVREIMPEDKAMVDQILSMHKQYNESSVQEVVKVIGEITKSATVVGTEINGNSVISDLKMMKLSNGSILIVMVCSMLSEQKTIELPDDITADQFEVVFNEIASQVEGSAIKDIEAKLINDVLPNMKLKYEFANAVVSEFIKALTSMAAKKLLLGNQTELYSQPEFDNVERLRELMKLINDEDLLFETLTSTTSQDDINVSISPGDGVSQDLSLITTKLNINNQEQMVGFVGSKRMEFSRISLILEYIKECLEGKNE